MDSAARQPEAHNPSERYALCGDKDDATCSGCRETIVPNSLRYHLASTVVKGLVGVVTGSKVLVAEAAHSLTDAVGFGFNYFGAQTGEGSSFVPSLIVGAVMFLSGVGICLDSAAIVLSHVPLRPGILALVVVGVSIAVNAHLYRISACVHRHEPDNGNLYLCMVQNRTNFFAACFAFAGVLLAVFGYVYLDPLAAVLVGCFQIHGSLQIFKDSFARRPGDTADAKKRVSLALGVLSLCLAVFFARGVLHERGHRRVLLVPSEGAFVDSPVSEVLAWAPYACVIDLQDKTIRAFWNNNRNSAREGSAIIGELAADNAVGVVLAKNIGPDVYDVLQRLGVRMYLVTGPETVGSAVTAYQGGRLTLATSSNVGRNFGRGPVGWLRPW